MKFGLVCWYGGDELKWDLGGSGGGGICC